MSRGKWAIVLVVLVVLAAVAVAYAAGHRERLVVEKLQAQRVQAQRFELVDNEGRLRAELRLVADCSAEGLLDEKARLPSFSFGWGCPNLTLYDEKGKPRVMLTVFDDGSPDLTLCDAKGKVMWSAP